MLGNLEKVEAPAFENVDSSSVRHSDRRTAKETRRSSNSSAGLSEKTEIKKQSRKIRTEWTKDSSFIHIHELLDNLKSLPKSQRLPLLSARLLISRKINIIIRL